jgi:phosphoglycerate dehydrogenase-like enzyme
VCGLLPHPRWSAIRASDRPGPPYVSKVGKPDDLLRFAAEADAVVAALPLTDATRHLFDATFFSAMRPTAYFINVGRGESVVTDDLLAALRTGRIGGAGLDVTDPEPLPPDHPLWRAPNLVITPHVSARSDADRVAHHALYRENLRRYASGEKLLSVVDAKQGY